MSRHNVRVKPIVEAEKRKRSWFERVIRRLFPKPSLGGEDTYFGLFVGWILIFFTGPAILYRFGELSREVIFGTAFQAVAMVTLGLFTICILGSSLREFYESKGDICSQRKHKR